MRENTLKFSFGFGKNECLNTFFAQFRIEQDALSITMPFLRFVMKKLFFNYFSLTEKSLECIWNVFEEVWGPLGTYIQANR